MAGHAMHHIQTHSHQLTLCSNHSHQLIHVAATEVSLHDAVGCRRTTSQEKEEIQATPSVNYLKLTVIGRVSF